MGVTKCDTINNLNNIIDRLDELKVDEGSTMGSYFELDTLDDDAEPTRQHFLTVTSSDDLQSIFI
jgi:hypothetical protein